MKKSHIARAVPQDESPWRRLPLVDLLVDTRTELLELAIRSGMKVFATMLEEDSPSPQPTSSTRSCPFQLIWSRYVSRSRIFPILLS